MGTTQSTRKITLVNDEKAGVIKLSESLAYRLRGQIEGQQAAASTGPAAAPEPPPYTPSSVPSPSLPAAPLPPEPPKFPFSAPSHAPGESQGEGEFSPTPSPEVRESDMAKSLDSFNESSKPQPTPNIMDDNSASEPVEVTPVTPVPPMPSETPGMDKGLITTAGKEATEKGSVLPPAETLVSAAFNVPVTETGDATPDITVPPATTPAVSDLGVTLPQDPSATPHKLQSDVDIAIKAGPGPSLSHPGGTIPPWSIYAEEAHLMVMRMREEKEQEIKKLNQDWRDKLDSREEEFTKMARLSEEEISSAVKEVERLFVRASCLPVCQNQQEAVMKCYQDHPRQALRCAREVDMFTQCVDLARLQSVMKTRGN